MKWKNEVTRMLAIEYPIVQAPMLGVSTPAMAAAIANAGGLGSPPVGLQPADRTAGLPVSRKIVFLAQGYRSMHDLLRKYIDNVTGDTITDAEFEPIKAAFVPKKLRKKQYFLQEGEVCRYMAFIVKGAMRQYSVDGKGVEHIIRFGVENWWMGDRESYTMLTPSRYNIDALEDCELLLITNAQMQEIIAHSPLVARMIRIMDEKNHIASQKRIHASISYTAEERYIDLHATNPAFLQRFPQNMIASYLGISPETLSRIRKQVLSK